VAVVAVVCVARADSLFTQYVSDVAYSRSSAAVVLLARSPCHCLRAALSSRLADQLTRSASSLSCAEFREAQFIIAALSPLPIASSVGILPQVMPNTRSNVAVPSLHTTSDNIALSARI